MNSRPGRMQVGQDDVPDVPGDDCPDDDDSPDDGDTTPMEFDDGPWEAFLPDDDQTDPLPEPGDFWIESDQLNSYSLAACAHPSSA